ncbi:hypothetical protein [Streptomyces sp. cg36]|uniref:hypothetical protein n=1 Tax=Streptomyces sp. cg36 TaxID=3238798 RepID=UPI0034E2F527
MSKRVDPRPLDPWHPVWERQDGESLAAWKRHQLYREMGEPTLDELVERLKTWEDGRWKCGLQRAKDQCREWSWIKRVRTRMLHEQRVEDAEQIRRARQEARALAIIGYRMARRSGSYLMDMGEKFMSASEHTRVFEAGARAHHTLMGDFTGGTGQVVIHNEATAVAGEASGLGEALASGEWAQVRAEMTALLAEPGGAGRLAEAWDTDDGQDQDDDGLVVSGG